MKRAAETAVTPQPSTTKSKRVPSPSPPNVVGSRYRLLERCCGEGTHGVVTQAIDLHSQGTSFVAVKRLKPAREGISTTAYREIALLRRLSHDNIISMLDVVVDADGSARSLSLVFEYLPTDMLQLMRSARQSSSFLEQHVIRKLMVSLCSGLQYLHARKVMHRDIKPANLLIEPECDWALKICDFGLARSFDAPLRSLGLDGAVVTLWYRSPELLLGASTHSPAVDMWASGCVLAEMLIMRPLLPGKEASNGALQEDQIRTLCRQCGPLSQHSWSGVTQMRHWPAVRRSMGSELDACTNSLTARIMRDACPQHGPSTPDKPVIDLLNGLLAYDPAVRLTASDALRHAYCIESSEDVATGTVEATEDGAAMPPPPGPTETVTG